MIDDKGRLFGFVNVIDALVLVLIVAVLAAGSTLVLSEPRAASPQTVNETRDETRTRKATIVLRTTVAPYVVSAAENATAVGHNVTSIEDVRTTRTIRRNGSASDGYGADHVMEVTIRVSATVGERDQLHFHGGRLYVGRNLRIDLGTTILDGVVTEVSSTDERARQVQDRETRPGSLP